MIVFTIFCLFTVFFWAAFEQGAGSLPLYTRDFTDRFLEGNSALIFKIVDISVTIVPLLVITYVLISLFKKTFTEILFSNIVLGLSFIIVWGIIIFKIYSESQSTSTEVPITWFAILNSLFIIIFAPLFSKWWDSSYNPPASVKYFLGLALLGIGFGFLAFGARNVPAGLKEVREFNVYQARKKYPWQGQYTRTGQRKNLGDQLANFKNSDGDYGGIAIPP